MVHLNVEKIRKAKGKSKTYIAEKIKLSLQGYRHIANGDTKLDVERLIKIANALEISVEVLLDDKLTESVVIELSNNATTA